MKREREPAWEPAEFVEEAEDRLAERTDTADADYRRRRKPVRVRRYRLLDSLRWLGRSWRRLLTAAAALAVALALYSLLFRSAWFVLQGSDQIALAGLRHSDPAQVVGVFSSDLGRNIFFIPLSARRRQVQMLPWVRTAAVLRLWPARLQVNLVERIPVAFARAGESLKLVDAEGVLLDRPRAAVFNFPVLVGLAGVNALAPNTPRWRELRQPQMRQYAALAAALDQGGAHHSQDLSEVDLTDPNDLRARVIVPGRGTVLIQFGDHNFAPRYALFLSQISAWEQKFPALISVDLQFDGQAIVDPGGAAPAAAKPAKTGAKTGAKSGAHPFVRR